MIIFPQGTRVLPEERPSFKKGVTRIYQELNIACQPVAINSGYVWPKKGQKKLEIDLKLFLNSVDRVASVSLDKKDGVKFSLSKDTLDLSVNNANSGDGKETLNAKFDHELEISFNSRYLIDVASQLNGEKIEIFFNDTGSPALIKDPSDFDSIYVVMPMKG